MLFSFMRQKQCIGDDAFVCFDLVIQYRDVAQLVARLLWEREQTSPLQKVKSTKKPCNTGVFGTLQNHKKA